MFGVILNTTNSSFQKCMTFCRSIHVKKVMKLLAFIFEQPSYYFSKSVSNDVASDVGVNLCNVKSCLTRQTMRFSQIREAIFLALIFLSTHAQL